MEFLVIAESSLGLQIVGRPAELKSTWRDNKIQIVSNLNMNDNEFDGAKEFQGLTVTSKVRVHL